MAISAVSKNNKTPRATNMAPRQINPKPIFWFSVRTMILLCMQDSTEQKELLLQDLVE